MSGLFGLHAAAAALLTMGDEVMPALDRHMIRTEYPGVNWGRLYRGTLLTIAERNRLINKAASKSRKNAKRKAASKARKVNRK